MADTPSKRTDWFDAIRRQGQASVSKEPESLTALKAELQQNKLDTFDYLRDLSRLSREDLDNAGFRGKTNAEAVKHVLDETCKFIEQKIQYWEKANPDE